MNNDVVITCAVTGAGDTVGKHPAIPVTPRQIADAAIEAARAGAAVAHLHVRDPKTGKDGPWVAGLTLEPSVVYEAWASQRLNNNIIVMIEEIHGKPTKAGESFSAAHIVGFFDNIEQMHATYDRYKGHTALVVDKAGWRLEK